MGENDNENDKIDFTYPLNLKNVQKMHVTEYCGPQCDIRFNVDIDLNEMSVQYNNENKTLTFTPKTSSNCHIMYNSLRYELNKIEIAPSKPLHNLNSAQLEMSVQFVYNNDYIYICKGIKQGNGDNMIFNNVSEANENHLSQIIKNINSNDDSSYSMTYNGNINIQKHFLDTNDKTYMLYHPNSTVDDDDIVCVLVGFDLLLVDQSIINAFHSTSIVENKKNRLSVFKLKEQNHILYMYNAALSNSIMSTTSFDPKDYDIVCDLEDNIITSSDTFDNTKTYFLGLLLFVVIIIPIVTNSGLFEFTTYSIRIRLFVLIALIIYCCVYIGIFASNKETSTNTGILNIMSLIIAIIAISYIIYKNRNHFSNLSIFR